MVLSIEEQEAARRAKSFFSWAWRIYDFFFFRLLDYGPAVEAYLKSEIHLKSGSRVLDAGAGTGLLTRNLHEMARSADIDAVAFHAFDLTPGMINQLEKWKASHGARGIETACFNVLDLSARPEGWGEYDHIVTSAMMEYLPRASLATALRGLGELLAEGGRMTLIITRANPSTNFVVGKLWRSNLYTRSQLAEVIGEAGFEHFSFEKFAGKYAAMNNSVIIAQMH